MKVNIELTFEPLDISKIQNEYTYWCIYKFNFSDIECVDILTFIDDEWYLGYAKDSGFMLVDCTILSVCDWNELKVKDGVIVK